MIEQDAKSKRDRPANNPFPAADDSEIIGPILDDLDASKTVRTLATEIASTAESTMWIVGKRRSTVAATSVYVAGCIVGESKPLYKQQEVADASSASKSSIINQYQDLLSVFESTK